MYYDLRAGGKVLERLGLDEMKQQLTNFLEGGESVVEVAYHGELPEVKAPKRKKKVSSRTT